MAELEKAHLVGAFDLGKALNDVRPLLEAAKTPYLLHVGSGIAAMGENRTDKLLERIPKGARYVGVGVGKRWNRAFMQAAAERTGGYFTQVNPDEPVAWRGMDLAMTLNTPRLLDVKATADKGGVSAVRADAQPGRGTRGDHACERRSARNGAHQRDAGRQGVRARRGGQGRAGEGRPSAAQLGETGDRPLARGGRGQAQGSRSSRCRRRCT